MSNRSTLGAGMPVGSFSYGPIDNPLLTMADGSQWLRGGATVPAASYPLAATLAHLKAHRFTRAATQSSAGVISMATDGAGTFVVVSSADATNVLVSTDGGQTWTSRAHNLGGGSIHPAAIVRTGSRFVLLGNDGSGNVYASTSTDGTTWVVNTIATGLSAFSAGTVDIAWDGTNVAVMVPLQDTTHSIYTSPSGLTGTWTARTIPASATPQANSRIGGGGLGFVISNANNNAQSVLYSTNNGVTWALGAGVLSSSANTGSKPMVGSNYASLVNSAQTGAHYSTNLTSWALVAMSTQVVSAYIMAAHGGGYSAPSAVSTNQVLVTADGLNWTAQITADTDATKPMAGSGRRYCVGNTSIVSADALGANYLHYAVSTTTAANGVGGSPSVAGIWRIK